MIVNTTLKDGLKSKWLFLFCLEDSIAPKDLWMHLNEKFSILALERSSELSAVDNASFVIANKSASFISSSVTNFRISSTELLHQGAKKKTKFVNLYSNDGAVAAQTIILKDGRLCNCQLSQHKLINNCSSCGRIVCVVVYEQEGSGPCLYCNEIVCTNEELQVLRGSGKKNENLLKSLREKGGGESLKKTLEQRDCLLRN
uniref:TRIP4/RQT4 C2HC5-type zinc finger domain-containing protein n=1 Tax=Glossina brevipalpis TaxID=37001 RepID=A0A1A9WX68_9MUSC